ncbi:unnamed protein product [Phyllotreta striolata]|uniref:Uncharacterized protein n=1 Tax=Phyllotreta striolata TaxID=444603 RepID=A0A9N9TWB9_PHYSR|nr:unnamed protein product [Phyllotreta striolata]
MRAIFGWLLVLVCLTKSFQQDAAPPTEYPPAPPDDEEITAIEEKSEKKLSETIMTILEHYKQPDPVGIPGAPIPDPMSVPDMNTKLSFGKMHMKDVQLYGLKKFRINHISADVTKMKVEAALTIDKLLVRGNYTLRTFFSRAAGPYTVTMEKVQVTAIATMEVDVNGTLEAQAMDMDISFGKIDMDFQRLGAFGSLLQGVMNSLGSFVFDSIKPHVLGELNTKTRDDVNKELRKFPKKFPNSISPFDQLVCEVRKKVRSMGFDPYLVPDYNNSVGIFDVALTNTWLYGISSFHRTRDIKFEMKNNTVHTFLEVGTGRIKGSSNWDISLVAGMISQGGTVAFTVDYIRVQVNASQSMDTSLPPSLDDIQLELGNIQIRFDGLGTVDYLIEFGVNVLPNLLRYQIMDALEKPIKMKIQEALDQVNVERIILENADNLDSGKGLQGLNLLD